jgi:hypothetical protein
MTGRGSKSFDKILEIPANEMLYVTIWSLFVVVEWLSNLLGHILL